MSKYAMSDIHGCYEKFIEMLKLINFCNDDELYIIGDIFDRGKRPLDILDYIRDHNNIQLIKGNHEQMYERFYVNRANGHGYDISWFMNGGQRTYIEIMKRGVEFYDSLYKYISSLPLYEVVDNNILVHAGIRLPTEYYKLSLKEIMDIQDEEILLWYRESIGHEKKIEGYNIICGHTPVQIINNSYENVKILNVNDTYYIDCGCVFSEAKGKLACVRLEDKEEFYV
ncbi:metallophosphoesterase family protein [Clostridium sp.]|jgi:serine/threonine protein phosphatase 1|uniref:metallophosphoesterase family protein n=1 Tax=Clostridium sp. TaxID=1506 RepID=UPI00258A2C8E|nr:metallophosphoesterase family protein [Clostridium sp.]